MNYYTLDEVMLELQMEIEELEILIAEGEIPGIKIEDWTNIKFPKAQIDMLKLSKSDQGTIIQNKQPKKIHSNKIDFLYNSLKENQFFYSLIKNIDKTFEKDNEIKSIQSVENLESTKLVNSESPRLVTLERKEPPKISTGEKKEIKTLAFLAQESGKVRKVGPYNLIRKIARGSMGEIYLAENSEDHIRVALKLLPSTKKMKDDSQKRFFQEAKVLSILDHPNIVKVHDTGYCFETARLYIALEYVEGQNLWELIKKYKKLSEKHSLQVGIAVANALQHALEKQVIHRDLKPSNILIDSKNRAIKVTDFGLGKIITDSQGVTASGSAMGTACYMPPEQIEDAKSVDHRADIYSLGSTLYQMVTGIAPYSNHKRHLLILKAKLSSDPIPLEELLPTIDPQVNMIISKSMARNINERYQTPQEMLEDMKLAIKSCK